MQTVQPTQANSYLDILFANRNKAYGAYQLRKLHNKHVLFGLCLVVSITAVLLAIANFKYKQTHPSMEEFVTTIQLQNLPEPKPLEQPEKPTEKPRQQNALERKHVVPVIVPDIAVTEEDTIPTVAELDYAVIGLQNTQGDTLAGNVVVAPSGTGAALVEGGTEAEGDQFTAVEMPAKFPGGAAAWQRYLERNLNNNIPIENNAPEGTYKVNVSFWVDTLGAISEVAVLNQPGYGIEAEAKRVIAKGPNWLPATQNGKRVAHRQQQAITFLVQE